ncbi:MAG: type II secretion system GspH family protein [Candidatus Nealsonbacteria bacterium]|nr:type II secretion system GspH family protein [Candidatus Nealsonbacteria bacterium]
MKNNKKGFTLIELLIVIGIITILASAVIVAINPGRHFQQARNATRWSHMNSIVSAVYTFSVDRRGVFPACITATPANVATCTELVPDFISLMPRDPQEGHSYMISFQGTRILITSTAPEAIAAGVQVLQ